MFDDEEELLERPSEADAGSETGAWSHDESSHDDQDW